MVTGAEAQASVSGPLTSGMVGIPVTIEYDGAWDGLTKNLMCRCSVRISDSGEIRSILNVGETATVAHEVMQANMHLHLGIEGFSADGKLVIPTIWAYCGKIEYGANTCDDPSTDPELSVWNQLQIEMEQTKEYVLTPEQAVNIQSYAQTAAQAAQEAREAAEEAKQTVESGLYYIPSVSQPTDTTLKFEFRPSISGAPVPKPVTVELPVGSSESGGGSALSSAEVDLLEGVFAHIQWADEVGAQRAAQLIASLRGGESSGDTVEPDTAKTLESISAAYSGGNVPVGTALSSLSGIVVTAHYSDGSTADITGYSLSGTIAEGENTITVTYMGKTTTFTVTGEAQAADGRTLLHNWVLNDSANAATDTIGGAVMKRTSATIGTDGWTVDAAWKSIYTPSVLGPNMTVEWDLATAVTDETQASGYNTLFKFGPGGDSGNYRVLFDGATGKWFWNETGADANNAEIPLDGINAFDGKTAALCIGSDGYVALWVDGAYIATSPWAISETTAVVGHSSGALNPCTVSGCRIYEGVL